MLPDYIVYDNIGRAYQKWNECSSKLEEAIQHGHFSLNTAISEAVYEEGSFVNLKNSVVMVRLIWQGVVEQKNIPEACRVVVVLIKVYNNEIVTLPSPPNFAERRKGYPRTELALVNGGEIHIKFSDSNQIKLTRPHQKITIEPKTEYTLQVKPAEKSTHVAFLQYTYLSKSD